DFLLHRRCFSNSNTIEVCHFFTGCNIFLKLGQAGAFCSQKFVIEMPEFYIMLTEQFLQPRYHRFSFSEQENIPYPLLAVICLTVRYMQANLSLFLFMSIDIITFTLHLVN